MTERYTATARLLHWATAAAVLAMFVLGIWMIYFKPADGALRHCLFNLHESLGVTILLIVLSSAASTEFRPKEALISGVLLAALAVGVFVIGLKLQLQIWPWTSGMLPWSG